MPYLQLDVNGSHAIDAKRRLAQELSATYADMMKVDARRISIAIRELGDGGVWRFVDGVAVPVAVLMCDIRRGRTPELRMELAKKLTGLCITHLGLPQDSVNVEFTQHTGDEMYHPTLGGYSPEWSADEQ
jgi:phenylpyruvate tautomerase PptA (4-oxalocrotonate tautomerase family)